MTTATAARPARLGRFALLVDVIVALVAVPVLLAAMAAVGQVPGSVELLLVLFGLTVVVAVRQRRRASRTRP